MSEPNPETEPDPLIGKSFGSYEIISSIASGGMGTVYRAQHTLLEKIVALKVLSGNMKEVDEYVERFKREAKLAAKLEHPNIVRIYDYGKQDEILYLVMQFVEGESLAERMKRENRLPILEAMHIAREIAKGLDIAHETGLVHRDIKPDNILISKRNEIMITDFGLVKLEEEQDSGDNPIETVDNSMSAELTIGGSILGTPYYMSPEQCQGLPDIDSRADLYSLGLILYGLVTGKVPAEGKSAMMIMQNRILKEATPPIELNPAIGPPLNDLIMHLLEREPTDRLGTARILVQRLNGLFPIYARKAKSTRSLSQGPAPRSPPSAGMPPGLPPRPPSAVPPSRQKKRQGSTPGPGSRPARPASAGPKRKASPGPNRQATSAPRKGPSKRLPPRPGAPAAASHPPRMSNTASDRQAVAGTESDIAFSDYADGTMHKSSFARGLQPVFVQPPLGNEAPKPPAFFDAGPKNLKNKPLTKKFDSFYSDQGSFAPPTPDLPAFNSLPASISIAPPPLSSPRPLNETTVDKPEAKRPAPSLPPQPYIPKDKGVVIGASASNGKNDQIGKESSAPVFLICLLMITVLSGALYVFVFNVKEVPLTFEQITNLREWTNNRQLEIAGKVNRGPVELLIGTQKATSDDDGNFNKVIELRSGRNEFKVQATDSHGLTVAKIFTVMLDDTPPMLTIEHDIKGVVTLDEERLLVGTIADKNPVEVMINGEEAQFDVEGRFQLKLDTAKKFWRLKIIAVDRAGNRSEKNYRVIARPKLGFSKLSKLPRWTRQKGHLLKGTSTVSPATVTFNGQELALDKDGNFETEFSLNEGENAFALVLKSNDGAGGGKVQNILMGYDTQAPSLKLEDEKQTRKIYLKDDGYLRGTASDDFLATVNVDGALVKAEADGQFKFQPKFQKVDNREIALVLTDKAGNRITEQFRVYSATHLSWLKYPVVPKTTTSKKVVLEGVLSRGPAVIQIGKQTFQVNPLGKFSIEVSLDDGKTELILKASAKGSKNLEYKATIQFDTNPPGIKFDNEKFGLWVPVKKDRVLRGTITDDNGSNLTLYCGTVKIPLNSSGRFGLRVPLPRDGSPKSLTFKVKDGVGNETTRKVLVSSIDRFNDGVSNACLLDLKLWERVGEEFQDRAIKKAGEQLGLAYQFIRTERYECGEISHRIAQFKHKKTGILLHLIPGGRFKMGSDMTTEEQPVREVTIRPYLIGRLEIVQREWDTLDISDERKFKGAGFPMEGVSWIAVNRWLLKAGGKLRLSRETEWEYACRAGSQTTYFWGDDLDDRYFWYYNNSDKNYEKKRRVHANSEHEKKANAFGLVDMIGNVKEWCDDDYIAGYKDAPLDNSKRGRGTAKYRVTRGGSWFTRAPECRSAARFFHAPDHKYHDLGFRVARSLKWEGKVEFLGPLDNVKKNKTSKIVNSTRVVLTDLELWNKASVTQQNEAIRSVEKRLIENFKLWKTQVFDCAGKKTRIAIFLHKKTDMQLCLIPGGKFRMGSIKGSDDEQPIHTVALEPFLLGRFELSQKEWDAYGGVDKREWKGPGLPIHSMSWLGIKAWLKSTKGLFRLPSESEWEYGCRAGSESKFFWGESPIDKYFWHYGNSDKNYDELRKIHAGSEHEYQGNAFGLVDMLGNVKEWVEDDYVPTYRSAPKDGSPRAPASRGSHRVARGGSWFAQLSEARCSNRIKYATNHLFKDLGCRVAVSIPD
jgi:formylglycine-generating enzyme required for sulfatase activity/serine/threonine protein kinase